MTQLARDGLGKVKHAISGYASRFVESVLFSWFESYLLS